MGSYGLGMGRPARVEDVCVVVIGDGRAEKQADCINCEEEFAEHGGTGCA